MRVVTPQIKLSVRIDEGVIKDDKLVMTGMAGMLPCEVTLDRAEIRRLIGIMPKVALLKYLLFGSRSKAAA